MAERKGLSKRKRFEVFKRDNFTCQYCGAKAPEFIMEIDHINPVSKGGKNEIMNLVTACFDCNRGKSNKTLNDGSVIEKQRNELELLNEKRNQMKMIVDWKKSLINIKNESVNEVSAYFNMLTGFTLSEEFKENELSKFMSRFGLLEVLESIEIGFNYYVRNNTPDECEVLLSKLGGILYNRKKENQKTSGRETPKEKKKKKQKKSKNNKLDNEQIEHIIEDAKSYGIKNIYRCGESSVFHVYGRNKDDKIYTYYTGTGTIRDWNSGISYKDAGIEKLVYLYRGEN